MLRQGLIVAAALALAACSEKRQTAMSVCKDLEAAGIAERCHDSSQTVCKYARERVTFYAPGGGERASGQVFRFANEVQFGTMSKMTNVAKSAKTLENKSALTLVQLTGDASDEAE